MDTNTFYYTFSTISQTLGGAIGILSAFLLFRVQSIYEIIKKNSLVLKENFEYLKSHLQNQSARGEEIQQKSKKVGEIIHEMNNYFINSKYNDLIICSEKNQNFIENVDNLIDENRQIIFKKVLKTSQELIDAKKSILFHFRFALALTVFTIASSIIILSITDFIKQLCFSLQLCIIIFSIIFVCVCLIYYCFIVLKALKEH